MLAVVKNYWGEGGLEPSDLWEFTPMNVSLSWNQMLIYTTNVMLLCRDDVYKESC